MKGIGGNCYAVIQQKTVTTSAIGSHRETWADVKRLRGWLDLSSGDSRYTNFSAKIQESTHIFVADYVALPGIEAENSRMVVGGKVYDILLIDNPMGMGNGSQLEIYLKYTGGQ